MARYISSIGSDLNMREVVYRELGRNYFFKVNFNTKPVRLHMGRYFVGGVSGVSYKLSDSEIDRIAPELVRKLQEKGYLVEVIR
jgi:hypothetical protein